MPNPNLSPRPQPRADDGRPWWQARWVKITAVLLFLITAFYLQANWLGTARWNQVQAEVTAAGESLDPAKLIPPSVPDEKNFAALPFFRRDEMKKALANVKKVPYSSSPYADPEELPYLGHWEQGERSDSAAVEKKLREICKRLTGTEPPSSATSLQLFAQLCPALAELRAEELLRPECRFNEDYTTEPAFNRPLGGITEQISLAKTLSYEQMLTLQNHRPDLALADLKIAFKVNAGLRQEPWLVSGLVALGVVAIEMPTIAVGLREHFWNETQLRELDRSLAGVDFLVNSRTSARGEAVIFIPSTIEYYKTHRASLTEGYDIASSFSSSSSSPGWQEDLKDFLLFGLFWTAPNGWFDQYKADAVRFQLIDQVQTVDPALHRVFPDKLERSLKALENGPGTGLWRQWEYAMLSPLMGAAKKFAYQQVQVDAARIACHLELYRLAHGAFPAALQDLPAVQPPLPHDPFTGKPYRYELKKDGTYLLYSVGWDKSDNGGTGRSSSTQRADEAPDWLWADYPKPPPK